MASLRSNSSSSVRASVQFNSFAASSPRCRSTSKTPLSSTRRSRRRMPACTRPINPTPRIPVRTDIVPLFDSLHSWFLRGSPLQNFQQPPGVVRLDIVEAHFHGARQIFGRVLGAENIHEGRNLLFSRFIYPVEVPIPPVAAETCCGKLALEHRHHASGLHPVSHINQDSELRV